MKRIVRRHSTKVQTAGFSKSGHAAARYKLILTGCFRPEAVIERPRREGGARVSLLFAISTYGGGGKWKTICTSAHDGVQFATN